MCGSVPNCRSFTIGSELGGWTVAGTAAAGAPAVDILNSSYAENGGSLHFTAEDGNQALDLTGDFNQGANGVEQTAATVSGMPYVLSFFLGNQDNAQPNYPLNSSVMLLINGSVVNTYTNSVSASNNVSWLNFTVPFTATGASTTIEFINGTPAADNYTGLDNITLAPAAVVPEPSSRAFAWIAFSILAAGIMRRKRHDIIAS